MSFFLFASFVPSQASFSLPSCRGWTPSILPLLAAAPKAAVVGPNHPPLPSGQMRKTPSPFSVVLSESLVSDRRTDVQRRNWGRKRSGGERGKRRKGTRRRSQTGRDGRSEEKGEGRGTGAGRSRNEKEGRGTCPFSSLPFLGPCKFLAGGRRTQ